MVIGALLALFPLASHALGLGKLKMHSALNEQLNAEIEFTSISEQELKGLNVTLAGRAEFDTAGVERLPFLSQIKFNIVRREDGSYALQLKTDQPIEEPFLHVLLQLEWPGGRLVREYTALIDPPYHAIGRPAGIEPPSTAPESEAELAPAPPVVTPYPATEPLPEDIKSAKLAEPEPAPEPEPKAVVTPQEAPPEDVGAAEDRLFGASGGGSKTSISPATGWPEDTGAPQVESLGAGEWANTSEYVVQKGDTLWGIAERIRADKGLSMEQVILAIFRANKGAFFHNNVNNLKAGKILKFPERQTVETIPAPAARKEFRAQYDVWQEYKLKLASASRALKIAETPAPAEAIEPAEKAEKTEKVEQVAKAKKAPVAAAPKEKPAAPREKAAAKPEEPKAAKDATAAPEAGKQPDELLKIVRANLEAKKGGPEQQSAETEPARKERQALAERVTTLEESLVSRQMETKELGDKLGQVRAQLKRESRLIELENAKLAQARQKPETPPAPEAAKPRTAPQPAEQPKAEKPKAEAPPVAPPTKVEKPPAVARPAAPAPSPGTEKDLIASLTAAVTSGDLLPIVGGVVLLIGGVIALIYFKRRRKSLAEFEESILKSDTAGAEAGATTDTTGQSVTSAGETSFLSDFSQGGAGRAHADEVDPVAEAEVYLAYGRDETAEEILKDAVVKNPERHELKQKLLEIYHQRNDVKAFETLAEELYAAGGGGGKIWEKVEEMGRKLNPANPMFRGGAGAKPAPVAAKAPTAKPAPAAAPAAVKTAAPPATAPEASAAAAGMESVGGFDFDLEAPVAAHAPSAGSIDFDLDLAASLKPAPAAEPTAPAPELGAGVDMGLDTLDMGQSAADSGIDFDLGKGGLGEVSLEAAPETAGAEIQWESMGAPAEEITVEAVAVPAAEDQQSQWDETATKLDLARAYIDMGDAEGARSILDEVMAEGN
ncbi:MAG: hypothetical protein A2637_08005, partial [Candidatus Muproteobacteria bacterium RIFCSPHIGHO2_01_FULL_65_16]